MPLRTKIVALLLLTGASLTLALVWLNENYTPPETVTRVLSEYQAHTRQTALVPVLHKGETAAAFVPAYSAASFGDMSYFGTTYSLSTVMGADRRLPFPPAQLWCVELRDKAIGSDGKMVVVALHEDLYVARWVVHEVTAQFSPSAVGCAAP